MPPTTDPLESYLHTAIRAALEAARIQRAYLGGDLQIATKSNDVDLVTRADKECETRIREILLGAYPDHVVLGEEQGQDADGRERWIVDPIDGTVNYAHGFPFFCVSIALEVDGELAVGVVYDPMRDELFTAVKGAGASLNGRPLAVTRETQPRRAMVGTGFSYDPATIERNLPVFARALASFQSVRRPGAAALDLCYVACGRLDAFWEFDLNAWDVAAGTLIIREAGGTVTGAGGAPFRFEEPALVASNGHLHGRLLDILRLGEVLV